MCLQPFPPKKHKKRHHAGRLGPRPVDVPYTYTPERAAVIDQLDFAEGVRKRFQPPSPPSHPLPVQSSLVEQKVNRVEEEVERISNLLGRQAHEEAMKDAKPAGINETEEKMRKSYTEATSVAIPAAASITSIPSWITTAVPTVQFQADGSLQLVDNNNSYGLIRRPRDGHIHQIQPAQERRPSNISEKVMRVLRRERPSEELKQDVESGVRAYDKITKLQGQLEDQKAVNAEMERKTRELEREIWRLNHEHRHLDERQFDVERDVYIGPASLGRSGYSRTGGGWNRSPSLYHYQY